ncbi:MULTISPECIES: N-acetyltransferase [unclassified Paraburkholderia]|uniref:GNAT family N-acetyltransferase n=1 Tax=unclassified Paraburkholderia TaxID=2615204 RepID=UPI002AB20B4A|nr:MULTISPECIES: N-acetyltransferase [unclassified Paraburkholderia]
MTIQIRDELPADIPAIRALTEAAFLHAPHTSHTEQFIVDALQAAGELAVSLVAVDGGEVVGHVALSPVALSDGSTGWFGLGPISVAPARQREGLGSRLVERALDVLRARRAAGCVLLGDPAYYRRFGFTPEPTLVLPGVPAEYFQAIALNGPIPTATVRFSDAFEARA